MTAINNQSDRALIVLLQEGDKLAFEEIYNRYKRPLQAHLYKKINDKDAVQDILQELFIYLWQQREKIQIQDNLGGYLYKAVQNRALNYYHRTQRENSHLVSLAEFINQEVCTADFTVLENELNAMINREVAQLPGRMQEAFIMSRNEGKSHKEIAEAFGTSEKTVSNQLSIALGRLRVRLSALLTVVVILNFL